MKKVLHINKNREYSGAENVAMNICLLLNDYNHLYASPKGKINEILKKNKVKHYDLNTFNLKYLNRVVLEYKPDIIHAHDVIASIYVAIISFRYKDIGIVSHLHNNDPRMKKPGLRWLLYSISLFAYDNVIVVSESVKKEYFGNLLKKAIVLPNIVNVLKKEEEGEEKIFDIVSVARLVPQKNPIKFLSVINLVKQKIPNVQIAYIGDGELRDEFLTAIKLLNLESNITYFGFQDNPYDTMRKSKTFLLTSNYEGFGLVALEAISLGLPTVTTHVGGLPRIVSEDVGKTSNDEKVLSDELVKLLTNEEYYKIKHSNTKQQGKKVNNIGMFKKQLSAIYNK